jgi:hypothetical protein
MYVEKRETQGFLVADELSGVEIFYFRTNFNREMLDIKPRQPLNARCSFQEVLPVFFFSYADRGDNPHTGYDCSSAHILVLVSFL